MAAYIVARITIDDRERYAQYEAGFLEIFAAHTGRLLAVDDNPEVLEGDWQCTRTVIAEFPNKEEALAWYRSDDYQTLAEHRFAASDGEIALLAGLGN
jgi:uncharacterized protein (DUF1330 family)